MLSRTNRRSFYVIPGTQYLIIVVVLQLSIVSPELTRLAKGRRTEEPLPGKDAGAVAADIVFYREKGCPACHNTGYSGRIGIFEFLMPDDEIKQLIENKASSIEIRDAAVRKGMKTMYEDGIDKLKRGITSVSEVLRVTCEG